MSEEEERKEEVRGVRKTNKEESEHSLTVTGTRDYCSTHTATTTVLGVVLLSGAVKRNAGMDYLSLRTLH